MNPKTDEEECPGCGSMFDDLQAYAHRNMGADVELIECPHCGSMKCCLCDMGGDAECPSCHQED